MLERMTGRLFAALVLAIAALAAPARAQTAGVRAEAVVELYTSQGCTQCPRANRLLGAFAREERVLALTFPVGIWDYLGWRDTFARPEFSSRQRAYAEAARARRRSTPQLIINGAQQVSAADWDDARDAFERMRAAGLPPYAPDLTLTRLPGHRVRVTIGPGMRSAPHDVWLVTYEPGPLTIVITGGVNTNRSVSHYNLARDIEHLGEWNGASAWFERTRCSPECAVLLQAPNGGRIVAAAYTR